LVNHRSAIDDDRHLGLRIQPKKLRLFLFARFEIDGDDLIRDLFLRQNNFHAVTVGGGYGIVESNGCLFIHLSCASQTKADQVLKSLGISNWVNCYPIVDAISTVMVEKCLCLNGGVAE